MFLEVGYADLETNYQSMVELASSHGKDVKSFIDDIQSDYPDPAKILEYARITNDRARQFVLDSDFVTVPSDDQCQVIYTPKADRMFEFAFYQFNNLVNAFITITIYYLEFIVL